ncbi:MAG: orotate phosphoribosyltransferase [Micavibrio aeruginosavorus]|nr:orotate phosphoribosyltransferase [Micavibrio aeruginosavorus]
MPLDRSGIAKTSARILLETKSVLFNAREPFIFTSGRASPVYTDCRRLISFPEERGILMDFGASILRENAGGIDYVAGGETAGIPYAAFIAERLNKPMLYIRKKPKGFGRMAQIEGVMDDAGKRVVLIEDLQSDGASKKVFIDALRAAGAVIEHSFVVFHYGIFPASEKNMSDMGVTLHALTTFWDVLAVAREKQYFDSETLDEVEKFLNAPDAWSAAHGGQIKEGISH